MKEFPNVIIIGLGLIGGSMALALKRSGYGGTIVGFDAKKEHLDLAIKEKAIDVAAATLNEALLYDGLILLAVPLGAYEALFQQIPSVLGEKHRVVTDAGSVKTYIHELAAKHLPPSVTFIGGHPMSGSEKGGFKAATPHLFENAYYFLTPGQPQGSALKKLKELLGSIGAFPVVLTPAEHDLIAAQISHVPHVLASVLANTLDAGKSVGHAAFVGGGFRDTTRIASGDPLLWKDIFFYNRDEVLQGLGTIETMLAEVKELISKADGRKLTEFLQRAKFIRDCLPQRGRDYLPVIYNITVDVEDKPGIIGQLTQLVGQHNLNIREIEVLHVRENGRGAGAIRIGFATENEQSAAANVLRAHNFILSYV